MYTLRLKGKYQAEDLEQLYLNALDSRTAQRLKAICLIAAGKSVPETASLVGRHVSTVRHWIKLFNEGGPAALRYRHTGGRAGKLTREQEQRLALWVRRGLPGGRNYTLKLLSQRLLEEFGVRLSRQQVSQRVSRLGLSRRLSKRRRKHP
jgi:transposase